MLYLCRILVFIAGVASLSARVCAYEVSLYVDEKPQGDINILQSPPLSISYNTTNHPPEIEQSGFKELVFHPKNISMIEKAAKALLYSHNSTNQTHHQPLPNKMFFEQSSMGIRSIMFYEGLYTYNDSSSDTITIFMSCIQAGTAWIKEPPFTQTPEEPFVTIAYTIGADRTFDNHSPRVISINIITTPLLTKPELVPHNLKNHSRPDMLPWALTGTLIGTIAAIASYPFSYYIPVAPLIFIGGSAYFFVALGKFCQTDDSPESCPQYTNFQLVQKGRFTTQSLITRQPYASASTSEPVVTDDTAPPLTTPGNSTRHRKTTQ
ncbi:hypothetical protein M3P05_09460 [Sansalvadorimonas sp. 2012CJ34-2]|uniref:Uncharacterized protein n=1 Tax=Parendozoicomonas callyspongiae TaxID=2942213 RepID=A0ABT0PFK7_9GAMM|nr:hypothetical protein [Sansalvadorimonas sp. 2012CJ34-2]MCL6270159.1 hypothetical protein [Sansalvadorimonas sp. 2012CJ34-2]